MSLINNKQLEVYICILVQILIYIGISSYYGSEACSPAKFFDLSSATPREAREVSVTPLKPDVRVILARKPQKNSDFIGANPAQITDSPRHQGVGPTPSGGPVKTSIITHMGMLSWWDSCCFARPRRKVGT
ncbi:hypothetical protein DFP73DRAFT_530711 [Morchella snyderi]|nr:hypothetical protein DFP73DRAFT_530711 [Morchella snyderi]